MKGTVGFTIKTLYDNYAKYLDNNILYYYFRYFLQSFRNIVPYIPIDEGAVSH